MSERLSTLLLDTFAADSKTTSLGNLVTDLGHHGMAIVLIIFSVPAALPLPAAGYSTLLSLPLFIIGGRLLTGRSSIWLPQFLLKKDFEPSRFSGAIGKLVSFAKLLERFSKPRFSFLTQSSVALPLVGLMVILLACSMALPIPGTNTAPAFAIFILGFGLLEKDGLIVLLGMAAGLVAIAISATIIFFGYGALQFLKSYFKDLFLWF